MTAKVKYKPEGYHTATPYLVVDGAGRAIEFYKKVFGATELMRMAAPEGKVGHAEIRIGDSVIMIADEHPEMGARGPHAIGGSPISIMLYVEDVDSVVGRAVAEGGALTRPVEDKFYGDRSGAVTDPFGHQWYISTHVEDVSEEEITKRAAALRGNS